MGSGKYLGLISASLFTGTFTNQIQTAFREPRLLIVADTRADHQPITESSYANIPVIAFCNVDSPTRYTSATVASPWSTDLMCQQNPPSPRFLGPSRP